MMLLKNMNLLMFLSKCKLNNLQFQTNKEYNCIQKIEWHNKKINS